MAALRYRDEHNKVGYLQKPKGSDDYHQVLDFLRASHIRTVQLQLTDDGGIDDLPIVEIYSGMDNLGTKAGSWDQFGSSLAVALIIVPTGGNFAPAHSTLPSRDPFKGKGVAKPSSPVSERTKKQLADERLSEIEAARLEALERERSEKEKAEIARQDAIYAKQLEQEVEMSASQRETRQAEVLSSAKHYSDADWIDIMAQVHANAGLSSELLGADVNDDNFAKRMVALINQRKESIAETTANEKSGRGDIPMTHAQQREYNSSIFVKNQRPPITLLAILRKSQELRRILKRAGEALCNQTLSKSKSLQKPHPFPSVADNNILDVDAKDHSSRLFLMRTLKKSSYSLVCFAGWEDSQAVVRVLGLEIINLLAESKLGEDCILFPMFMSRKLYLENNGTEFVNQTLREYYEKVGISHETSISRSPQQNGVVERRNHTLIEAARTMLIYAKAPLFLWVEAVATACYTQTRYGKTPYELLHNKPPDLSYLHVFGALCYPTNDSENLGKLQPKTDIAMASETEVQRPALHELLLQHSVQYSCKPSSSTPFVPPSRTDLDIYFNRVRGIPQSFTYVDHPP
ncbi:retrovirus-related pol polyprotein from transposon TNT 1-94 [Tanacetum coccineum]